MPATNPFYPVEILRTFYDDLPESWDLVTRNHEYEDASKSFNELSDNPPLFWELHFTGLTIAQKEIFKAHWREKRLSRTFDFLDKAGFLHPDTYYAEPIQVIHDGHRSWDGMWSVRVKLVQYTDANVTDGFPPTIPLEFTMTPDDEEMTAGWDASTDEGSGLDYYELEIILGE